MNRGILMVALAAWSAASPAGSQAASLLPSEADFFSEQPIVLSASRLAQPLSETPAAVTILDREMIEASGFIELADLLRLVPGFQVGLSTMNHSTAVTYHGQSDALPRRLEVLVDGRSVYGAALAVYWHDLGVSLDDVERIEVLRGPSSPVYGANAFTATVNIITQPRYANPGWYARTTLGSRDTRAGMLRKSGSLQSLDYRFSLAYDQTDGFAGRNDEKRVGALNLRGWLDLGPADTLDFMLGYRGGTNGRGGDDPLFNPRGPNPGDNTVASGYQQVRWTRVLGSGRDTSVEFYHQHRREEDDATLGRLSNILPPAIIAIYFPGRADDTTRAGLLDYTEQRYDLEWQYNDASSERLRWMAGAGARLDRMKGRLLLGRDDFVRDLSGRVFVNAAYRLNEQWVLNAGGMLEHGDLLDKALSYRLGLNRQLTPQHAVRASVTRSLRKNSLLGEHAAMGMYFDNGDPVNVVLFSRGGIEPEEMLAWEVGWLGSWLARKLTLDVKAFREEIRKEIRSVPGLAPSAIDPLAGTAVMINGGGVDITGLEGQLQYRPAPGTLASLQFSLARADDRYDPASAGLPSVEGRTPRKTISLLLAHTFANDLQLSLGYYHVDRMRWEGPGEVALGKPPVPAYDRVDLRLAKRLRFPGQDVLLELIAQNVGNDAYAEFRADNRFETRYFLRASAQFH